METICTRTEFPVDFQRAFIMAANVVSERASGYTRGQYRLSFSLRRAKSDGKGPKRGLIRTREENNRFSLNGDE